MGNKFTTSVSLRHKILRFMSFYFSPITVRVLHFTSVKHVKIKGPVFSKIPFPFTLHFMFSNNNTCL